MCICGIDVMTIAYMHAHKWRYTVVRLNSLESLRYRLLEKLHLFCKRSRVAPGAEAAVTKNPLSFIFQTNYKTLPTLQLNTF